MQNTWSKKDRVMKGLIPQFRHERTAPGRRFCARAKASRTADFVKAAKRFGTDLLQASAVMEPCGSSQAQSGCVPLV
jgi:hypothetical protein